MPKITVLSDILASQVAAGEVVERPASVMKELIENSLDAGANRIEIEIRKGGIAQLKVSDNGHGMDKENALLSLERHATSKLTTSEGLAHIYTHGFRGEALPSITSVSRFKLTTNDNPETPGTSITVAGGTILSVDEIARATGTTIEAKDLFFNIPARRKFLKSESTEYAHIEHAIRLSALGNATVRYIFKNNGNLLLDLKPTENRKARIVDFSGHQVSNDIKEILPYKLGKIEIQGYLLPGRLSRGTSKSQTVFINGRPVDDPILKGAIRDGYHGHIQSNQFPVVWIWIQMPAQDLDVNVHPAKREVRFARPSEIKHAIVEALANTLTKKRLTPIVKTPPLPSSTKTTISEQQNQEQKPSPNPSSQCPTSKPAPPLRLEKEWGTPDQQELSITFSEKPPPSQQTSAALAPLPSSKNTVNTPPTTDSSSSPFRIIGHIHQHYWLMEDDTGLVIVSPKAAHQRILYENLKTDLLSQTLTSQKLLLPLVIEIDRHDFNTIQTHLEILNELGIEMSHFGGNSFQVLTLPSIFNQPQNTDIERLIFDIIDSLESKTSLKSTQSKEKALERLLIKITKLSAQRQPTALNQAESIIKKLMKCELPYCAPNGKPTMIHYAMNEMKKKFT